MEGVLSLRKHSHVLLICSLQFRAKSGPRKWAIWKYCRRFFWAELLARQDRDSGLWTRGSGLSAEEAGDAGLEEGEVFCAGVAFPDGEDLIAEAAQGAALFAVAGGVALDLAGQ
jgi:hypothetical protein